MKEIDKKIKEIIQKSIDIHVHIGPEIIPRKYTVATLLEKEKGKLGGCVLKNHFYATSPFVKELDQKNMLLFGGIVLNNFVGGLNPEAIYAASVISKRPLMVWFPTVSAENFLQKSVYEIAPEWVNMPSFKGRFAKDVTGISVLENGILTKKAIAVLQAIKNNNAVLATGHISIDESERLVEKAREIEIEKIVITHPIYQRIDASVAVQKKFARMGCFIEICYSMYSIDNIPIRKIAQQIRTIGSEYIILSSDVGQTFSLSPSEALTEFCLLLLEEGISLENIEQMMVKNSRNLLGIE